MKTKTIINNHQISWGYLAILLISFCLSRHAFSHELIIGTTFSTKATAHLIQAWEKQPDSIAVRTLNRTSASLSQLLSTEKAEEVDLILSSSPMLFYGLQEKKKLTTLPSSLITQQTFVPDMLKQTTIAFSLSGYGILSNRLLLNNAHSHFPHDWQDLTDPKLYRLVIISSPTRSDTNHIMLEGVLQKHGWDDGWAIINRVMANVGTISSRSFGVVDKVQANLGAAGITIDNYANLLLSQNNQHDSTLVFNYFPDFAVSPTFIAVTADSNKKEQAFKFIDFLLSPEGQNILSDNEIGKFPIIPLPSENAISKQQQFLFSQPQIDYTLMIKRQELVKLLFEHQITYRLNQLQENWQLLYQKEQKVGHEIPQLRHILTLLPVTAAQASDDSYLTSFNTKETLLSWQHFFSQQQAIFIETLEGMQ